MYLVMAASGQENCAGICAEKLRRTFARCCWKRRTAAAAARSGSFQPIPAVRGQEPRRCGASGSTAPPVERCHCPAGCGFLGPPAPAQWPGSWVGRRSACTAPEACRTPPRLDSGPSARRCGPLLPSKGRRCLGAGAADAPAKCDGPRGSCARSPAMAGGQRCAGAGLRGSSPGAGADRCLGGCNCHRHRLAPAHP